MNRLLVIGHVLGGLLGLFSLTFVLPVIWSLVVGDGMHPVFIASAAACLGAGLTLLLSTRRYRRELQARDGALLVVLAWFIMTLAAMPPFLVARPDLSVAKAFFEVMAGLTTTGATVLDGLESLPPSLNLWRHALQWYGGMGIIVLAVAVLPLLGVGGMQLFKAETPGPMKEGKLTPRITQTAKGLWLIYVALTVGCMLALKWAGMDWFEAVCHAFSAIALGGFSTRDASIGAFDSVVIEAILGVFMLAAVINFATHFVALRARSVRVYTRNLETVATLAVILGGGLLIAAFLYISGTFTDFSLALRHALFNTISVASSTGYASQDFGLWPPFAAFALLFLSCVSASAGSTGGGIKMVRAIVLVKQASRELARLLHPRAVMPLTISGQVVENRVIFAILGFMLLWGITQVLLTFVLMFSGIDVVSAFSVAVAMVNNLGPALGEFGPSSNYAALSDFQATLLAVAMLAGRLELLTFFALLTPAFWRR